MKKIVLSAAIASLAFSGIALAKGKGATFNCKAGDEMVELGGKTSFTNKEKKKFGKECKSKKGKWVKEEAAAASATTPAEGTAGEGTEPGME